MTIVYLLQWEIILPLARAVLHNQYWTAGKPVNENARVKDVAVIEEHLTATVIVEDYGDPEHGTPPKSEEVFIGFETEAVNQLIRQDLFKTLKGYLLHHIAHQLAGPGIASRALARRIEND